MRLAPLAVLSTLLTSVAGGAPVTVRHHEGVVHGFLVLRTLDGALLANGDLIQNSRGDQVTSRLVFHFKDGSIHDDTAVYSQRQRFRLVRDHLIQRGPSFPHPLDVSIDGVTGVVQVRHRDDEGEHLEVDRMTVPPDLANGMILTLLKNLTPDATPAEVSLIAATPKPRLVKLAIAAAGQEPFSVGGAGRQATHFVVNVKVGGVAGVIAPLVGKQPPDSHVWILQGPAPAFVKSEGPLYFGGPSWRIELTSPVWPRTPPNSP